MLMQNITKLQIVSNVAYKTQTIVNVNPRLILKETNGGHGIKCPMLGMG